MSSLFTNYGNVSLFSGSTAQSVTTGPVFLGNTTGFAFQATTVGISGSVQLQASVDNGYVTSSDSPTVNNWSSLSGTLQQSSGSTVLYNVSSAYYPWIRAIFTFNAGTGSLEMLANTKTKL